MEDEMTSNTTLQIWNGAINALVQTVIGLTLLLSTPEQKCIGLPEQKYINDASQKAPETGVFCSGIRLGSDYLAAAYPSSHGVSGACSD
jgi:hypothetical protein